LRKKRVAGGEAQWQVLFYNVWRRCDHLNFLMRMYQVAMKDCDGLVILFWQSWCLNQDTGVHKNNNKTFLKMVFTAEDNVFIKMTYFQSDLINENGYWKCSRQSVYHRFLVLYPEE
jgi:hypothetical protein